MRPRAALDCTIRLYLADDDILAIHTLAYAALTVLTNYDNKANKGSVWGKIIRDYPHQWSQEIANFLKPMPGHCSHLAPSTPRPIAGGERHLVVMDRKMTRKRL